VFKAAAATTSPCSDPCAAGRPIGVIVGSVRAAIPTVIGYTVDTRATLTATTAAAPTRAAAVSLAASITFTSRTCTARPTVGSSAAARTARGGGSVIAPNASTAPRGGERRTAADGERTRRSAGRHPVSGTSTAAANRDRVCGITEALAGKGFRSTRATAAASVCATSAASPRHDPNVKREISSTRSNSERA
jgi:hypothetical protein